MRGSDNETSIVEEQFLAGRSLTFWESICSIVATEVSALTFLGIPAYAFSKDFSFIHIYLGAVLGRLVIARIFLPKIYGKGVTLYGIMRENGGSKNGQRVTSLVFFITKLLAIGVRLFSGSILVAEFFDVNIYLAVTLISLFTFIYTLVGGLKAVARTDISQMLLFVSGGILAHFFIPKVAGQDWSVMMNTAYDAGKLSFFDFSNPYPFIIGLCGGFIFDMATHGVDQDFAQRLMGCRSLKTAQRAISYSSILSIAIGFIFLGVGSLLWAHYQAIPMTENIPADRLFAYFITEHFPSPLKGLMVAGVLAATMSTLDSTINALSSCFWNDILPGRRVDNVSSLYRRDTLIITLLLLVVAFASSLSDSLLMLGLTIVSWTIGSMLSLFVTKLIFNKTFTYRLTAFAVIGCFCIGIFGVYLNTFHFKLVWHFNTYIGFTLSTAFLFLLSKIGSNKSVNE